MRIVVFNHVSLDGVMQSPAGADEDTRDGFDRGGWAAADNDAVLDEFAGRHMAQGGGGLLLGRRSYEHMLTFWNTQPDSPFTPVLNNTPKYVASTSLHEPLPWPNSTLLGDDVPAAVAALKEREGGAITILGSGALIQSLLPHGLIDAFTLMIHPVVLGRGHKLFAEGAPYVPLELTESITTTTGVVIATYERR
jgi:dihydrofolate reductase